MFEPKQSDASHMILDALWFADGIWRVADEPGIKYQYNGFIFDNLPKTMQDDLLDAIRHTYIIPPTRFTTST